MNRMGVCNSGVQRDSKLTLRREVNHYLLVTLWVLFPPQYQK